MSQIPQGGVHPNKKRRHEEFSANRPKGGYIKGETIPLWSTETLQRPDWQPSGYASSIQQSVVRTEGYNPPCPYPNQHSSFLSGQPYSFKNASTSVSVFQSPNSQCNTQLLSEYSQENSKLKTYQQTLACKELRVQKDPRYQLVNNDFVASASPQTYYAAPSSSSLYEHNGHDPYTRGSQISTETYKSSNNLECANNFVCFGMVTGIAGTCGQLVSFNTSRFPVQLESAECFVGVQDQTLRGKVKPEFTYLTSTLLEESALELEASSCIAQSSLASAGRGKPMRNAALSTQCSLDITIYGPIDMFEDIGSFFQENELYLQDPAGCKWNVPYCNPHRLPLLNASVPTFTFDLRKQLSQVAEINDIGARPDLLELLTSQEYLPETPQPPSIKTPLATHQKQSLTFMLRREEGWAWDGSRPDIWEASENGEGQYFTNRISDTHQNDEPPQFYGGIIADPMGLGKTLSMIALVASDIHPNYSNMSHLTGADAEESSGRSLVIVPPPLLSTWEEQLTEHVVPNSLPWYRHHAKSRLTKLSELEDTILVLTTYHTVSTEWRNGDGVDASVLFKTRWRRVILDEGLLPRELSRIVPLVLTELAHFIRNSESQMARAICSLDSVSRWAVTGTPIQNRLSDLTALLKFLKVYPYSEKKVFEADISYVWKSGDVSEASKRLKRLAGCLLLRRPKSTIQLPARQDLQYTVDFSPAERRLYDDARMQTIARIDGALFQNASSTRANSFVNVLQQIEALRMICNLGVYYPGRHEMAQLQNKPQDAENWNVAAQGLFNLRREMGHMQCHYCSSTIEAIETLLGDSNESRAPRFSRCLRFICPACTVTGCGHNPSCAVAYISTSPSNLEEPSTPILPAGWQTSILRLGLPTKVAMLLEDLQKLDCGVKCVVFSTWAMTLDVIEAGLNNALIPTCRFDGRVPQKDRQGIIERFRNDRSIRVMLLTLSCGAVGLTLTCASRAYLMEPHWNPTLEDQALARIHRMGQTREVATVRFCVRDTFEQRVIELQKSKKDLAGLLLDVPGEDTNQSGSNTRSLESLRELI